MTLGFTHNPAGQIVQNTRSIDAYSSIRANANVTDAVNGLNQVTATGSTGVTHDARGNISAIGSASYIYSQLNQLLFYPGGRNLYYEPLGRLIYDSAAPATTFILDGADMIGRGDLLIGGGTSPAAQAPAAS